MDKATDLINKIYEHAVELRAAWVGVLKPILGSRRFKVACVIVIEPDDEMQAPPLCILGNGSDRAQMGELFELAVAAVRSSEGIEKVIGKTN